YLKGRLIGVYFAGYGLMRFLLELIRTDTTFRFLGLSRNGWVSIGVMLISILVLAWPIKEATGDDMAPAEMMGTDLEDEA
ncbi:MAG: prolipoprotein diacylglyceryl transferase family protein, partial [Acidimicrobiia bacterium]